MSNDKQPYPAQVESLHSISRIWLIPIIAVLIGAWMIYFHLSNQGPSISISFINADGIEAGKTKIKIKNVDIGVVKDIKLSDDLSGVIVTAQIRKHDMHLLKKDAQFWVVRPKIGKGGISGLSTLLSGAYIELSQGFSKEDGRQFKGLENKPVTPAGTAGLHVTLDSRGYRALQIGDLILFHGMNVGRIEYIYFNAKEQIVYYDAFIESPYDKLLTTNTKFWEINGMEVDLSADGFRVESGTLEALISGGITFDVPNDLPRGETITQREYFTIYPNKNAIDENRYKYGLNLILLFKDSIRGLKPDAPVEYRGVRVGTVRRTDINYPEIHNLLQQNTLIPVMISIEPGRIGLADKESNLPITKKEIQRLLKSGLRGSLATGSLLTGRKYIELEYAKGVVHNVSTFNGYLVIPTTENSLDKMIANTSKVMTAADKTLIQATRTLKDLQPMVQQLNTLLKQSSDEQLVAQVKKTLQSIDKLSKDFSEGSITNNELQDTLHFLKAALAELEPLLNQLNRKPNSLIFSGNKNKDIEPKGMKLEMEPKGMKQKMEPKGINQ